MVKQFVIKFEQILITPMIINIKTVKTFIRVIAVFSFIIIFLGSSNPFLKNLGLAETFETISVANPGIFSQEFGPRVLQQTFVILLSSLHDMVEPFN